MSEKRPQPTAVLVGRLQRLAKALDREARAFHTAENTAKFRARANTCWQAAARLELLSDPDAEKCEGCNQVAIQRDDADVPLCDACYDGLDSSV